MYNTTTDTPRCKETANSRRMLDFSTLFEARDQAFERRRGLEILLVFPLPDTDLILLCHNVSDTLYQRNSIVLLGHSMKVC
jgi:hypothetical protein